MKRTILPLLTFLGTFATQGASAPISGTWVQHPPFDDSVTCMADTPTRTYMMSLSQVHNNQWDSKSNVYYYEGFETPFYSVHYYDKASDSTRPLLRTDGTGCSKAQSMAYNASKGYLMVTYTDLDIDLVYDDGRVVNIPDLKSMIPTVPISINNISFDHSSGCAYLATSIGYAVIDDSKMRLKEWYDYATSVSSVARLGNMMLLSVN